MKRQNSIVGAVLAVFIAGLAIAQDPPAAKTETAGDGKEKKEGVELKLRLPRPAFKGTPTRVPPGTNLEEPRKGPRPAIRVPEGTRLVSHERPITSSDSAPIIGKLKCVTDGDKEAQSGSYVELGPGLQWVQIDLEEKYSVEALLIWHYHASARVYHDVIVQVSDDPDFIEGVKTVFNNDHDNSAGLGVGKSKEYWDTFEGKLIPVDSVVGRYVRCYSNGSTADDMNHYTEVEVFCRPVK